MVVWLQAANTATNIRGVISCLATNAHSTVRYAANRVPLTQTDLSLLFTIIMISIETGNPKTRPLRSRKNVDFTASICLFYLDRRPA